MKTVALALVVVAMSAAATLAAWPAGVIANLDGTGVTPTGLWAGGTSLEISGLAAIGAGGTTTAVEYFMPSANDYSLSARISSTSPSEVGLFARGDLETGNAYALTTNFGSGSFNLIKIAEPKPTNLLTTTLPWFSSVGTYDMKLSTSGSYVFGRLTDVSNPLNTHTFYGWDNAYSAGAVGALISVNAEAPPLAATINGKYENLNVGATDIMPGDSDWSGTVNFTDLNNVLTNYNLSGKGWADGDFDHNGIVDFTDLNTVLTNYNLSVSGSAAVGSSLAVGSSPVPEPSMVCLIISALAAVAVYRLRR